jgi:hypothetical protein
MNQIAQRDDVGDCSCAEPNILMLVVDLRVLLTKAAFQKRSIVD